jgi:hypothetical protein
MTAVISEHKKEINKLKEEIVLFWEIDIKATAASSFLLWRSNTFGSNTDVHYTSIRTGGVGSKKRATQPLPHQVQLSETRTSQKNSLHIFQYTS